MFALSCCRMSPDAEIAASVEYSGSTTYNKGSSKQASIE